MEGSEPVEGSWSLASSEFMEGSESDTSYDTPSSQCLVDRKDESEEMVKLKLIHQRLLLNVFKNTLLQNVNMEIELKPPSMEPKASTLFSSGCNVSAGKSCEDHTQEISPTSAPSVHTLLLRAPSLQGI